jgi:hypothetical protein
MVHGGADFGSVGHTIFLTTSIESHHSSKNAKTGHSIIIPSVS